MILTSKNKKALQSVKPFLCPPPKKTQHTKRENDFLRKFAIFELFFVDPTTMSTRSLDCSAPPARLRMTWSCPTPPRAHRGLGLASPQRFFRSFLTPKKNTILHDFDFDIFSCFCILIGYPITKFKRL